MRVALFVLGMGLVLGTHCEVAKNPVASMGAKLSIIRFPQPWSKSGQNGQRIILTLPQKFVVRKTQNSSGGELLFAVQEPGGSLSDNFYAVSLDGQFSVRPITEQAWESAERIAMDNGMRLPRDSTNVTPDIANYNGKAFAKTGVFWSEPVAITSGRNWVSVFSYTTNDRVSQNTNTDFSKFLGGGEPDAGQIFVDIYDTSSAEKILAGGAPFARVAPSILFSNAIWADVFFIMPLDSLSQSCFLGILPPPTNRR